MPPSKITDELIDQICEHIRDGNYVETSCLACGIAKRTFYNWAKRGEQESNEGQETIYARFYERLHEAYSLAEVDLIRRINRKDEKNWQRLAWILERSRQQRFGQRQQVEVGMGIKHVQVGPPNPPKTHEEWLERRAQRMAFAQKLAIEALPKAGQQE